MSIKDLLSQQKSFDKFLSSFNLSITFKVCTATKMPNQTGQPKRGLLERLNAGELIVGDGGYVLELEKRGYVKAGPWTPEATVEYPEAVRQLHREFQRAGADVLQALTFYGTEDKLELHGNTAKSQHTGEAINQAACDIVKQVAAEGTALTCGSLNQIPSYANKEGKQKVQAQFQKQVDIYVKNNMDFLLCEMFLHCEEIEWAIEVCKKTGKPVVAMMSVGSEGELDGKTPGECAVRMVKAGADVIGLNCHYDPFVMLKTIKEMQHGLAQAGLKSHFITQPLAYHTPDAGKYGFIDLPEFPFALEPRVITRWDAQRYAREAYNLGVRYIGGCCGFEPYHIRAISEELTKERGHSYPGADKHSAWGSALQMHTKPWVRARANREHWENLQPSTGRPFSASMSKNGGN